MPTFASDVGLSVWVLLSIVLIVVVDVGRRISEGNGCECGVDERVDSVDVTGDDVGTDVRVGEKMGRTGRVKWV